MHVPSALELSRDPCASDRAAAIAHPKVSRLLKITTRSHRVHILLGGQKIGLDG